MEPTTYSRHFLRIKPDYPVFGEIRVVRIAGRHVLSNQARVRLVDISSGGVGFVSVLKLPVDEKVILELSIKLDETEYRSEGYIVRSLNAGVCEYEYGFRFMQPAIKLRQPLQKIFGRLLASQDRCIIIRMSPGQSN